MLCIVPFKKCSSVSCFTGWCKHQLCRPLCMGKSWFPGNHSLMMHTEHLVLIYLAPLSTATSQITIFFSIPTSLLVFPTLVLSRGPESAKVAIERHSWEFPGKWMWLSRRCRSQGSCWRLLLATELDPMCQCLLLCWNKLRRVAIRLQTLVLRSWLLCTLVQRLPCMHWSGVQSPVPDIFRFEIRLWT